MNKPKALKTLGGSLKFGDPVQIQARKWLELAAALESSDVEVKKECPECGGFGTITAKFDPDEDAPLQQLRELAQQIENEP